MERKYQARLAANGLPAIVAGFILGGLPDQFLDTYGLGSLLMAAGVVLLCYFGWKTISTGRRNP